MNETGTYILAEGNTYEQREPLKFNGFRWSPLNKAWWLISTPGNDRMIDRLTTELDGVRFRWVKDWSPDARMA